MVYVLSFFWRLGCGLDAYPAPWLQTGLSLYICFCRLKSFDYAASPNGRLAGSSDPIVIMETHLAGKGLFKPDLKKTIVSGFGLELDKATRLFVN